MPAKYYLYRNLHTGTFSVKYKGVVISHPRSCLLTNVQFKVSKKGQARVRKEKRKNVHATLAAHKISRINESFDITDYEEVYYNPYKTDTFVFADGTAPSIVYEVVCTDNKIYIKRNN